jgi:ribonuclease P protein component
VYREGSRRRVGGVIVYRAPGELDEPEVCFVAGKAVGNAVERNRAKRRLREAARRIELEPATAHVFVASRDVLDVPFDTLVDWLQASVDRQADMTTDRAGVNR